MLKKSVFPNKAYLRQQNLWSLGALQVDTNSRVARAASGRAWFPLRITVAQTLHGASNLIRSAASSPDASAEWQSLQTQYGSLAWAALTTRGNVHVRQQGAMCMLCGRPIEKTKVGCKGAGMLATQHWSPRRHAFGSGHLDPNVHADFKCGLKGALDRPNRQNGPGGNSRTLFRRLSQNNHMVS